MNESSIQDSHVLVDQQKCTIHTNTFQNLAKNTCDLGSGCRYSNYPCHTAVTCCCDSGTKLVTTRMTLFSYWRLKMCSHGKPHQLVDYLQAIGFPDRQTTKPFPSSSWHLGWGSLEGGLILFSSTKPLDYSTVQPRLRISWPDGK